MQELNKLNKVLPQAFSSADTGIIHKYKPLAVTPRLIDGTLGGATDIEDIALAQENIIRHAESVMSFIREALSTGESLDGIGSAMAALNEDLGYLRRKATEGLKFRGKYDKDLALKTLSALGGSSRSNVQLGFKNKNK